MIANEDSPRGLWSVSPHQSDPSLSNAYAAFTFILVREPVKIPHHIGACSPCRFSLLWDALVLPNLHIHAQTLHHHAAPQI